MCNEKKEGPAVRDMMALEIAAVCHAVNKAYCEALGDHSQLEWDDAPGWQKESVLAGVEFHLDHPNSMPEDSHGEWLKVKADDGWVFGNVKDEKLKTHPCMVPFGELPVEQRAKDHLFLGVVRAMVKAYDAEGFFRA